MFRLHRHKKGMARKFWFTLTNANGQELMHSAREYKRKDGALHAMQSILSMFGRLGVNTDGWLAAEYYIDATGPKPKQVSFY